MLILLVRHQAPIFVLGMLRSGTSCLTGILEEAGLFLGDVKRKSRFNAKGNRPHPAFHQEHLGIKSKEYSRSEPMELLFFGAINEHARRFLVVNELVDG